MIAVIAVACAFHAGGQLPDDKCTPGSVLPTVTQTNVRATVCAAGWASAHRNVTAATRRRVYARYGLTGPHPFPEWELDHRVPLELGGSNQISNLWPQHHPQPKDRLENRLHDQVCAGQMTLARAQRIFKTDWRTYAH